MKWTIIYKKEPSFVPYNFTEGLKSFCYYWSNKSKKCSKLWLLGKRRKIKRELRPIVTQILMAGEEENFEEGWLCNPKRTRAKSAQNFGF